MISSLIFLLVFLLPLALYLFNAYSATRKPRGIAGGVEPPKRARAKVTPIRKEMPRADCGRTLTHLWLSLVGARASCRYCAARAAAMPAPAPSTAGDAEAALAEVERLLDDTKP